MVFCSLSDDCGDDGDDGVRGAVDDVKTGNDDKTKSGDIGEDDCDDDGNDATVVGEDEYVDNGNVCVSDGCVSVDIGDVNDGDGDCVGNGVKRDVCDNGCGYDVKSDNVDLDGDCGSDDDCGSVIRCDSDNGLLCFTVC